MTQSNIRKSAWPVAGLAALFLSGCTLNPMMPGPRVTTGPAPAQQAPSSAGGAVVQGGMTGDSTASGAEQACIAAGRERGLEVLGVVGSRAVTAGNGDTSRDVILRVSRNGAVLEPRCNYDQGTGMARIMLI